METQLEQFRDQQKKSWDTFSPGWKKWDEWLMGSMRPVADRLIARLALKDTDNVLDVATGTGEPGLTIARQVPNGKVTGQDLSEGMLQVAVENARRKGVTNYETVQGDVSELPFEDGTFDAVSCRFGYMFFPDMALAAREMLRVLKPGGRLATSVWGAPDRNFWASGIMKVIAENVDMPKPPPGAPGLFRCADTAAMQALLENAGFAGVAMDEINGVFEADSIDYYWTYMTEIAAPVVSALNDAAEPARRKIKQEVFDAVGKKYAAQGPVRMDYYALVFSGRK